MPEYCCVNPSFRPAIFLSKEIVGEEKLNDQSSTPVLSRIRDARFKRMVNPVMN